MRIGLLTLTDDNTGATIAGGKHAARLQAEFAIALGCERIIIQSSAPGAEAFALQTFCEGAGHKVQLIRDEKPLVATVKAEDEVLVLSPDIVPFSQQAADMLKSKRAILAIDADDAGADDFERIDLNHHWAGALTLPGNLVASLVDLPEGVDVASALLRVALQAKVPLIRLGDKERSQGRWGSLSAGDLQSGPERNSVRFSAFGKVGPANWLAERLSNALMPKMVARSIRPPNMAAAPVLTAVAGAGTGIVSTAGGLVLLGLAWLLACFFAAYERRIETPFAAPEPSITPAIAWVVDGALILIIFIAASNADVVTNWPEAAFVAIAVVGLIRVSARLLPSGIAAFTSDRLLCCLILAAGTLLIGLQPILYALGIALIAAIVFHAERAVKDNHELTETD